MEKLRRRIAIAVFEIARAAALTARQTQAGRRTVSSRSDLTLGITSDSGNDGIGIGGPDEGLGAVIGLGKGNV
jgi:hypothetical protein